MVTAEPLVLVPLYGKGAIIIHDDKTVYKPESGVIHVPPTLVDRVLAMGFSRAKPDEPIDTILAEHVEGIDVDWVPPMGNDV